MDLERSKNARRNIVFGFLNRFVQLVLPFANRTIFIYTLGALYLGLNSLFTSVLQLLSLAELGIGSAIVYSMYKPIAEDDRPTVCALLRLYRGWYRRIGLAIGGVGLLLLPFLPYFVHGDVPPDIDLHLVYLVFLANTVISYFCFAYLSALPTAFQRMDLTSNIATSIQVLQFVLQVGVLLFLPNYYVYILIGPFMTLASNLLLARVVRHHYPAYRPVGEVPEALRRDIRQKILGLCINKICQTSRNALDSICISAFIGLTITAVYNNYLYVIMSVTSLCGILMSSILAGIGNSIALYSRAKNYEDMRRLNFAYMWVSGVLTIMTLCLYQPFMEAWVGQSLMFPMDIVLLLVLYFYILKMGDVRATYSDAAGLWWENRYRAIAESIANVVLNIVLGYYFGVAGIVWATILALFFINFGMGSQIVFHHYFKNGKIYQYFGDHARYFCVTALVGAVVYVVCLQVQLPPIPLFFVRFLICAVLVNLCYLVIYRHTKMFEATFSWLLPKVKLGRLLPYLVPKKEEEKNDGKT